MEEQVVLVERELLNVEVVVVVDIEEVVAVVV
jgi:hypothetical protein